MKMILLLFHVHDLMAAGSDSNMDTLTERLNTLFKTNLVGQLAQYSGCSVSDSGEGTLMIRQNSCIEDMVKRFDVSTKSSNPASTTTDFKPRERLEKGFEGPYRHLIRGPNWIPNATRPVIVNAVREVAEQDHNPAP